MNPVFTLIGRELLSASRKPATWRARTSVAAMGILGALALVGMSGPTPVAPNAMGAQMFLQLTSAGGLSALGLGVMLTSDSISSERREGTLGLLFLTDLSGWSVVLGKAGAAVAGSAYALMSMLPIFAIGMLLGGVTLEQVGMLAAALLNALFVSTSVSMWISTWCTKPRQAAGLSALTLFAITSIPLGAMFWLGSNSPVTGLPIEGALVAMASPVLPLGLAVMPRGTVGGISLVPSGILPLDLWAWFVAGLVVQQGIAWALLGWAAARTRTVWQDAPVRKLSVQLKNLWSHWTHGSATARRALRVKLLDRSSYLWLSQREIWKPYHPWILLVAFGLLLVWQEFVMHLPWRLDEWILPMAMAAQILFCIWIITESAARLVEERHSGSFELLLCTPLDREAILHGQWLALRRMFLLPMLLLLGVDLWLICNDRGPGWAFPPNLPGFLQRFVLGMLVSLPAVRWVATLLALQGHTIQAVSSRTMFTVWFAPAALAHAFAWICEILRTQLAVGGLLPVEFWGGLLIFCAGSWIVGRRAKDRVRLEFRELATQTKSPRTGGDSKPVPMRPSGQLKG